MIYRYFISLLFVVFTLPVFADTNKDNVIYDVTGDVDEMLVHVRAQGKQWSVLWDYIDEQNYRAATIKLLSTSGGDEFFNYLSQITISKVVDGNVVASRKTDVSHANKDASIKLSVKDNVVRIYAGDGTRCIADNSLMHFDGAPGSKVLFRQNRMAKKVRISKEINYRVPATFSRFKSLRELGEYLANSKDSIEGYWQYLDRNINAPTVLNGGYYDLAVVKSAEGYDILYVGGAEMYTALWQPLQVKGRLYETIFKDDFDLEWTDGRRSEVMNRDVYVSFEQNAIMTVHFPLLKSEVRFSRKKF
jgi:hypothetical protein